MRAFERQVARLRTRLGALAADARGATLVEFGLLFPVIALLVLGTIDVARGVATKFALEQAAQHTIENAARGGQPQPDYSFLKVDAAERAGVDANDVTFDQWLECHDDSGNSVRQSSFTGNCPDGQTEARYVEISISDDYMPTFGYGPLAAGMPNVAADGSIRITADAGVRVQ